ncbi:hypothetical protein VD0003_g944 [Verticillium dahliae]|nr:hypothetical protein VD0003_g944 [Verticillium dahliae]
MTRTGARGRGRGRPRGSRRGGGGSGRRRRALVSPPDECRQAQAIRSSRGSQAGTAKRGKTRTRRSASLDASEASSSTATETSHSDGTDLSFTTVTGLSSGSLSSERCSAEAGPEVSFITANPAQLS